MDDRSEPPRAEESAAAALDHLFNNRSQTEAWRSTARWMLQTLQAHLGDAWLAEALEGDADLRTWLFACSYHRDAFLSLLEFALRLEELAETAGMGKQRGALSADQRLALLRHSMLVLEIGALGRAIGHEIAFEVHLPSCASPVDVVVGTQGEIIPVEARVICLDKQFREQDRVNEQLATAVLFLAKRHGVSIDAKCDAIGVDQVDTTVQSVARAAAECEASSVRVEVHYGALSLVVEPASLGRATRFSGPILQQDVWQRVASILRNKARKTYAPRPVWLRVDVLNGLWQLTPWAGLSLRQKGEVLTRQLVASLADERVAGLIVTSGLCTAMGTVDDETEDIDHGVVAFRRAIKIGRVRESFIVLSEKQFFAEAVVWRRLLEHEPLWLEGALLRAALPSVSSLFTRQEPD